MIQVTSPALDEIKRLLSKESNASLGLRISVEKGGCSGLSYNLTFSEAKESDDVTEVDHVKVYVDKNSSEYLKGLVLDFEDGLQGRGFKFQNPNVKKSCHCGESFAV